MIQFRKTHFDIVTQTFGEHFKFQLSNFSIVYISKWFSKVSVLTFEPQKYILIHLSSNYRKYLK
jgi:hypothetical protein